MLYGINKNHDKYLSDHEHQRTNLEHCFSHPDVHLVLSYFLTKPKVKRFSDVHVEAPTFFFCFFQCFFCLVSASALLVQNSVFKFINRCTGCALQSNNNKLLNTAKNEVRWWKNQKTYKCKNKHKNNPIISMNMDCTWQWKNQTEKNKQWKIKNERHNNDTKTKWNNIY